MFWKNRIGKVWPLSWTDKLSKNSPKEMQDICGNFWEFSRMWRQTFSHQISNQLARGHKTVGRHLKVASFIDDKFELNGSQWKDM